MRLIDDMRRLLETEESPFRAQLLREDIARLTKLQALAAEHETLEAFAKAGLYIGWTRDDMRTHEIKEPLQALLAAIHRRQQHPQEPAADDAVMQAWTEFNRARMAKLVHCL